MMPELVTPIGSLALLGVISYLVGAVPFGIVITRLFGLGDLRQIGSGNIGATNVLRTGNKLAAFLTLILDAGKGAGMVLLAAALFGTSDAQQIAGFCAFLGHILPVWLAFKGGKGVATYLGTLLALSFFIGAAACLTWLAFALAFRISSLAALSAAIAVPIWLQVFGLPEMTVLAVALGALVWMRHASNIRRIMNGSEPKIGASSKKS